MFVQQRFLFTQYDSQMKRKENHNNFNNFIVIIISFICYTIVFVLYVLQDKIWHIVISWSMMSAHVGGGQSTLTSLILDKGSSRGQVSCPVSFLVSFPLSLHSWRGRSRWKRKIVRNLEGVLLICSFVSQRNASSLLLSVKNCHLTSTWYWIVNI